MVSKTPSKPQRLRSHSIILIHGLHGNETRTWTYGSGHKSVFWPQDLLPADTGEARILSFGYDANIAHIWARPSENRLDSYSDDLLQQLDNNRHKIGAGLVDAVNGSESIRHLASCVRRIAFLGTPHQGSDKAQWAETGRRFVKLFKTTNAELSKDLDEKSEKLAKLGVQFPALLNSRAQSSKTRIDVVCFYEGLSTRLGITDLGMIVKESSACLAGYPRTLLDANHENMCKFQDRNDINYIRLSGLLARWVNELKSTAQGVSDEPTWFYLWE
ncbi:MAG: hypothetical protein LQ345_006482 [Seirophora villosa]|nr:MAG: hypothetical protein LQ345_006482 [Seirophora villosa]